MIKKLLFNFKNSINGLRLSLKENSFILELTSVKIIKKYDEDIKTKKDISSSAVFIVLFLLTILIIFSFFIQ